MKKIGSNHSVLDKKVLLDVVPPFDLVSEYRTGREIQKGSEVALRADKGKGEPEKDRIVLLSRDGEI